MFSVFKVFLFYLLVKILSTGIAFADSKQENFDTWLISYKKFALSKGISQETLNIAFENVKFLEQVIKYDRKQP